MPIGPFKDFGSCVLSMKKKYKKPGQAEKVCGALKKRLEGAVVPANEPVRDELGARALASASEQEVMQLLDRKKVTSYVENGDMFIKLFLIDGSLNYNNWGVSRDSIARNIHTVIGKPVVLYKNTGKEMEPWRRAGEYDHPEIWDKDYHHALAYQDLYGVAHYIDYIEKDGAWWGIAKVTNDGVKQALLEDPDTPMFDSPTVRLLHPQQDDRQIEDWEFMHSALVDRPAYGVKKAFINGQCTGAQDACLLQLRRASIVENGVGCGFCTYAAVREIGQNMDKNIDDGVSSHLSFESENVKNTIMSANERTLKQKEDEARRGRGAQDDAGEERGAGGNKEQNKELEEKRKQLASEQEVGSKPKDTATEDFAEFERRRKKEREQIDRDEGKTELLDEVKRLSAENASLRSALEKAETDKSALTSLNKQFNDRLAKIEDERAHERQVARRGEIEQVVNGSLAYRSASKEVKENQIEMFDKSGMSVEQIRGFISVPEQEVRKASINARSASGGYRSRLEVGRDGTVVDTRSATIADSNDERKPKALQLSERLMANGGVVY